MTILDLAKLIQYGCGKMCAIAAVVLLAIPVYAAPDGFTAVPAERPIASPVGTWELNLTFPGNPAVFNTVFTFAPGGGFNAIANDALASSATSVVGAWARIGPESFELSFIRYLFNPPLPPPLDQAVVLRGYQTFTLKGKPQRFAGDAVVKFFDGAGNLLGTVTSKTEGARLPTNLDQ